MNRPDDDGEFKKVNTDLTQTVCDMIQASGRAVPMIFASSVHVEKDNPYGLSKLAAEEVLLEYSEKAGVPVHIFRLPHVIG